MAAVYLAHEIALDRKVAIKVMAPSLMVDPGMIERFGQEARTMAALNHPHIVTIYSVRTVERLYFFAMQFVQGCSLSELIANRAIPIRVAQAILHQVGSALEYAHTRPRPVIHRDIKPANIILDTNGNAVVTDFGIAKVAESPSQTMTGGIIGTPAYMSPEQCQGELLTGASDQYSLGVVAYQLLTGATPFTGSVLALQMAHLQTVPPPIRERRSDCPPELEAAVHRMLEKRPENRWSSLTKALQAIGGGPFATDDPERIDLRDLIGRGLRTFAPTPVSPTPSTRRPRRKPLTRTITQVSVLLPAPEVGTGDAGVATAVVIDSQGEEIPDQPLRWSSTNPQVVTVSAEGRLIARAPGTAAIVAQADGVEGRATLEVVSPKRAGLLARIPAPLRAVMALSITAGVGLGVWLLVQGGSQPVPAETESAGPDTVTIGPVPPGPTPLRLTVSPRAVRLNPGDTVRLRASVSDGAGALISGRMVTWSSSDPRVATVSSGGVVTARTEGSATMTAESESARAAVVIHVIPRAVPLGDEAVATIAVTPPSVQVGEGKSVSLAAELLTRDGRAVSGTVTWSVEDQAVATVVSEGTRVTVTGRRPGNTRVWAMGSGLRGEATVTVTPAVVDPGPDPVDPRANEAARIAAATAVIQAYEAAINAKDLSKIRELYPRMATTSAQRWNDLFGNVRNLTARIVLGDVRITGSTVTASFQLTLQFIPAGERQSQEARIRTEAVIEEIGGQWRFVSLRDQPG